MRVKICAYSSASPIHPIYFSATASATSYKSIKNCKNIHEEWRLIYVMTDLIFLNLNLQMKTDIRNECKKNSPNRCACLAWHEEISETVNDWINIYSVHCLTRIMGSTHSKSISAVTSYIRVLFFINPPPPSPLPCFIRSKSWKNP